jgi:hypothetical protein
MLAWFSFRPPPRYVRSLSFRVSTSLDETTPLVTVIRRVVLVCPGVSELSIQSVRFQLAGEFLEERNSRPKISTHTFIGLCSTESGEGVLPRNSHLRMAYRHSLEAPGGTGLAQNMLFSLTSYDQGLAVVSTAERDRRRDFRETAVLRNAGWPITREPVKRV